MKSAFWSWLAGGALLAAVGGVLIWFPCGDTLARLSYDLPFLFQSRVPDEIVMVYLDSIVKANLGEPTDQPLNRRYHARLVRKLKQDGAKLILFDILFDEPDPDPLADEEFAKTISEHGGVVLVAYSEKQLQANIFQEAIVPPIQILQNAAAGWGLARLTPDPDGAIRKLDSGTENLPSAGWIAAGLLGADATRNSPNRLQTRWLNYYGPPTTLRSVNLDHALAEGGLSPGFFRDKIAIVGSRPAVSVTHDERDEFANPYSRFGRRFAYGAEIHAFSLLNLTHGDWLKRADIRAEFGLVTLWGFVLAAALVSVRPWPAAGLAAVFVVLIAGTAVYFQLGRHVWWAWLVPAAVQTPVGLVWSVSYRYSREARRRKQLRQAFAAYLSPHLADRIAESDFDLSLGGKDVEATVMFTDLEDFTYLSETLNPQEVSTLLTTYFNQTTRSILEQEGTIIKYMGDSVMAVWGAPLPDAKHAERAVMAAWGMIQAGRKEVAGRKLRTRIGISTGQVLAGNLGSDFRFDYTLIGHTTNLASRLEGLNKYLGTDILVSEATRQQLGVQIRTRNLGRFRVAGKSQPVTVHEVLGMSEDFPDTPAWLAPFDRAIGSFAERDFDQAERLLRRVIEMREGRDGPAEFYLNQISAVRLQTHAEESWDGSIVIATK